MNHAMALEMVRQHELEVQRMMKENQRRALAREARAAARSQAGSRVRWHSWLGIRRKASSAPAPSAPAVS
jgi:hypothetical protein